MIENSLDIWFCQSNDFHGDALQAVNAFQMFC